MAKFDNDELNELEGLDGEFLDDGFEDDFDGPTQITMYDDEGGSVECDLLGFVDYEGERYAFVAPVDDDSSAYAFHLKRDPDDPEAAILDPLDDDDLAVVLYEKFKLENADIFDFDDEEDGED